MTSEIQNIDKQLFDDLGRRIGMTTLQIAELTGKRHDNIVRKYLTYCDDLGVAALNNEGGYLGRDNANRVMYVLDYNQTLGLVTGFRNSSKFNATVVRQRIIDEWSSMRGSSYSEFLTHHAQWANQVDQSLIVLGSKCDVLDDKLTNLERGNSVRDARLDELESHIAEKHGYKSAKRFASEQGLPTDITYLQQLGRLATQISNKLGITKIQIRDPNYQHGVGGYKEDVLHQAKKLIVKSF